MKKPLQRIVTGGTFTAIAFFVSGILELELAVSIFSIIYYLPIITSEGGTREYWSPVTPLNLWILFIFLGENS